MSHPWPQRRSLPLPEGRRLAYLEVGDPTGAPILYCHGFPSSAREALLLEATARARKVRIIAPDRPGYGRSDFTPERTIGQWAWDVARLADRLGLGRFAVIGVSGGAPYALACAWRLPERLTACTLVCPLGPIYLPDVLARMRWPTRVNLAVAQRRPVLSYAIVGRAAGGILARWPQTIHHLRTFHACAADRTELADGATREVLSATIRDAMRGGARGARQDLLLLTRDWGLPFDRIALPITLWHGALDATVPPSHAQWYLEHLPDARLHLVPGEGHYSLPLRHADALLSSMLTDACAPAAPEPHPQPSI